MPSFRSPTLGDISLGLRQDGYAQLQNTFGNLGLVLDLNLLPLRLGAELAAFRSGLASSRAALVEPACPRPPGRSCCPPDRCWWVGASVVIA